MSDKGYIYLERKMRDNPDWQRRPFSVGQAWVDLLLLASYKDHVFFTEGLSAIEVPVKRGQTLTSQLKLAKMWGWSRKRVKRQLVMWKRRRQVDYRTTPHHTLITITNYDRYQTKNDPMNDPAREQQTPTINKRKEKEKKSSRWEPCKRCRGKGFLAYKLGDGTPIKQACSVCRGKGKVWKGWTDE